MPLDQLAALVTVAALVAYALLGGADFGGGVWDLLARGPRAAEQRAAVSRAMGPVWEANHVWLIFLIVMLFVCFPTAFSVLSIALFIPFHLVLLGIVLRGAAFVFRPHGPAPGTPHPLWSRLFGIASTVTPFLLGMCLGVVSTGRLRGGSAADYWGPWLSPFCWSVGALALATCASLAAVYLTVETRDELREDFRSQALRSSAVTAGVALVTLVAARVDAPRFWGAWMSAALMTPTAPVIVGGAMAGVLCVAALATRRYGWARLAAGATVTLQILGWALAQHPYLIYPDHALTASAAPAPTLRFVLWSLVPGGLVLIPSMALLFRVFKTPEPSPPAPGTEAPLSKIS